MKYVLLFFGLLALTFVGFVVVLFIWYRCSYISPTSSSVGFAENTLREINWSDQNLRGKVAAGEFIEPNADCPFAQLKVQNTQDERKTFSILTINDPCITSNRYALTGMVKYEHVQSIGYLEMWSYFPTGGMYFSRGMNDSGPMQCLNGSSNWRPFTLPFYIDDTNSTRPIKLDFNVFLPLKGTVYLGPIKLVQFETGKSAATGGAKNVWWNDRTAGLVGGIAGAVVGLMGAAIGILAGVGIARKVCLFLLSTMFVLGIVSLVVGLAALAFSQPYAVYYPLLLLGLLCSVLPMGLFRTIKQQYEQKELRKMHAMDVK
jgi:hypothetical protein